MYSAMKDKSPFGLNEWLIFLKNQKFPVRAKSLRNLRRLYMEEDYNVDSIQQIIAQEPFLALAIINEANRMVSNSDNDIKTPSHAASMVGANRTASLLSALIAIDKTPSRDALLKEFQTSYEAAAIAKHWIGAKFNNQQEDFFWITFFKDAARWLMRFYALERMQALDEQLINGLTLAQAENKILGCRLDELSAHLYRHWNTPKSIIQCFLAQNTPNHKEQQALAHLANHADELPDHTDDRRLIQLTNSPFTLSFCASRIAAEATLVDWDSRNLPFYYRVLASCMHWQLGKAIHSTHLASTEAAKLYDLGAKTPLAQRLLNPHLYTAKNAKTPKRKRNPLEAFKASLNKTPADSKLQAKLAIQTIKQLIPNAERALVLISKNQKIQPVLQFGHDIKGLKEIRWNSPSSVMKRLQSQRSASHLSGEKLQKIRAGLPENAHQILDLSSHAILASAPTKRGDTLLFWLDTQHQLNTKDYQHLKQIITLISEHAANQ